MRLWPVIVVLLISCEARTGEPGSAPPATPTAKDYRIDVQPKAVTAGSPASCEVTVTPAAPWVLKAETPFTAVLSADAGLKVDKARLDGKDFVDPKSPAKSVRTACVAENAGEHTLSAKLSFFLCSHEICKRMVSELTAVVKAN